MLFVNIGLARRLEAVAAAVGAERAQACAKHIPGVEAATMRVGAGVAVFAGAESPLTQAIGLGMWGQVVESDLDAMEEFFDSRGAATVAWICPFADPSLLASLARRGYRLTQFLSVLVRRVDPSDRALSGSNVDIRRAAPEEADLWAETLALGWEDRSSGAARLATTLFHQPSSTEFLAWIGKEAVAGASVAIHDGVASLSSAATRTEFRGRGAHSGLLLARLAHAAEAGCDLAAITAPPGTVSQRNAERAGFRVIYTKAQLTRPRR